MADKRIQQYPDKNNPSSSDYILIADSQDIDVNGFRKYKKIKISSLDNIVITNAEDIERQDLIQLLNDNEAVIGRFYRITDSQIGEPILVQAVALNMISEMSVSGDDGVVYFYDIVTDTRTNIQHVEINGTGFVKANGTTITYDNSTYLTNINGITAGGELSGTYPNPSLSNNAVTGKVLTGLSISGSSITSTDSILTSLGKLQNQINSLVGGVKYQGTWNASTNTPTLVSSVGTNGFYYVVDVAGSTNLNGITDWKVGDWAIFNGTTWQKVDNTDSVISVNGYTGAVTLTTSDIAEGTNLYYTDARVRQAISENIVGINYDTNTGVFSLASGYVIPTTTEQSNWNTAYNNRISSLTTVGNSGAATLVSNTLNIPNYTLGGLGGVPYTGATANVDLGEFGIKAGYFEYDLTPTNTPTTQGTTYWDSTEETVALIMNGAIQHIGLDTFYNVKNGTGSTILKGTAVRFDGTDGGSGHLLIAPMLANGFYPSTYYMGITAEDIGSGDYGKVIEFGKLRGINTNSYTNGDILYVSTSSAGGFQTTVPTAPNNIIIAAAVVRASNNGTLMVRATLGSNINSDEGVKITSPTTGQLLQLQSNGLWENKTKAQVLGGTSSQFVKGDGSLDSTSYQPLDSDLTAIAGLSGDGLLRKTSGTWGMDTNTYLTANQTITISGEASGSGATSITLSLDNNSVTGKVLNGLSISGGSVVSTDSILVGIGKLQNQVNALAGGVNYQGTWNASTNNPSLTSSVGVKGYYYVVSVAGSTNLDGITDWKLGDWAIFNGSTWQKVDNTDAVISVNGYTGAVTLTKSDVGLGNVENTALSTWAGSTNITTLGTIGTGVWNGTAIGDSYISSASTWNAKIGGSGTSGKLAKFTSSGAVGDSILSESGSNIILTGQYLVATDSSFLGYFGKSSVLVSSTSANDTAIFTPNNFNIGTGSSNLLRLQIKSNGQIITNSATDTGEAHIFGGSARVNGFMLATGLLRTQDRLYITGDVAISSWISSSLTAGYSSTSSYGWINSQTSLRLGVNGSTQLNLTTSAATFSSSVTTGGHITSGAGVTIAASNNLTWGGLYGANIPTITASHTNGIYYYPIGSSSPTALFRMTTAGALIVNGESDNGVDKLQVNGSARVNGVDPFLRINNISGNNHGIKISYSNSDTHGLHLIYNANVATSFIENTYPSTTGQPYGDIHFRQNVGGTMTTRILIKAENGNVGIGTTSPTEILHLNSSAPVIRYQKTGVLNWYAGNVSGNSYIISNDVSGNSLELNVNTGAATFSSSVTTGGNIIVNNGSDRFIASTSGVVQWNPAGVGGLLSWDTGRAIVAANSTNALSFVTNGNEHMRITSGGNVGIGTTSPASKLHINTSTDENVAIGSLSSIPSGRTLILQTTANGGSIETYSSTSGYVNLLLNANGGNVGIGTTSPTAKLDVNGAIAIGNTVTASVATPSTHQVEIVIGGVTYYLLATT